MVLLPQDKYYYANLRNISQGIRILFTDETRFIYRIIYTSKTRATLHIYVECYENEPDVVEKRPQVSMDLLLRRDKTIFGIPAVSPELSAMRKLDL